MKIFNSLIKTVHIIVYVLLFFVNTHSEEIFLDISDRETLLPVPSIGYESDYSIQKDLKDSKKGFCSIEEASEKLFYISNTNWGGDSGIIQDYKKALMKECMPPQKYYPPQIIAPNSNTPLFVCYKPGGACGENYSYNPEDCAKENEVEKLNLIYKEVYEKTQKEVDRIVEDVKNKAMRVAKSVVERKITQQLAENPFKQVRLSWKDVYETRAEIARILAQRYKGFYINVFLDTLGKYIFSNMDFLSPVIALSGPAGYVLLSGLPIVEETFQCNISIKNMIIKGALSAGTKLIIKVPIIKSESLPGVMADKFIKSATITEASKWIKHFFGDGLEVENVDVVKEYGKEFAIITVKTIIGTGVHFSNK